MALITRVQSKAAGTAGTAASSLNLTFDSNLTVGNIVVVAACTGLGSAADRFDFTAGINFLWHFRQGANGVFTYLAIGRIYTAGPTVTLFVTLGNSTGIALVGAEYSGLGHILFDHWAGTTGSSTSPASGATDTTVYPDALWAGALGIRGTTLSSSNFSSPTNSFSIVGQTTSAITGANADRGVALLERIVTATGAPNAGATSAANNNWSAIVAAYGAASGIAPASRIFTGF